MKKISRRNFLKTMGAVAAVGALSACGAASASTSVSASASAGSASSAQAASGTLQVDFWSAPNQAQFDFWSAKAEAYNATGAVVNGQTVQVQVQQMPESPSSEAGIQNAIVTGTVPAASENVSTGFAALLAQDDAVYPLEDESWYQEIVTSRDMASSCEGWKIGGKQYVIPLYINPMSYQWNAKALKAMGYDKAPETLDDFKAVLQAFLDNKDSKLKDLGVAFTMYRAAFTRSDQWWERWYDFQMQYMSFSKGTLWVDGDKLTMDAAAAKKTFELYGMLGNTIMTDQVDTLWTDDVNPVLFSISAPWDISKMTEAGKVYGEDYLYGPTIVEAAGDKAYSFADSKGLVLYKNEAISDDEHQGAVDFISWVYGKDNAAQSDYDFWKTTNMMPVRGDLSKNDKFADIIADSPALGAVAEYIPNAVPCMSNASMQDIQTAFGESGMIPYLAESMTMEPLNAPDASSFVEAGAQAMKQAGNLS